MIEYKLSEAKIEELKLLVRTMFETNNEAILLTASEVEKLTKRIKEIEEHLK